MVLKNPLLRALAGSAGTFSLFGNCIGALYALYVIRQLGAPPIFLGLLLATGGVSALVGALLAERVVGRFGLGRTVGMGLFLYGAIGLLVPLAGGSVALALTLLFTSQLLGDASVSIYLIAAVSLRQSLVPANLQGRTHASIQFLSQGSAPVGVHQVGFACSSLRCIMGNIQPAYLAHHSIQRNGPADRCERLRQVHVGGCPADPARPVWPANI